jgi:phage-related protein
MATNDLDYQLKLRLDSVDTALKQLTKQLEEAGDGAGRKAGKKFNSEFESEVKNIGIGDIVKANLASAFTFEGIKAGANLIKDFTVGAVNDFGEVQKAFTTLEIVSPKFGQSAERAKQVAKELATELKLGVGTTAESLQNLFKSGLNIDQASDLLRRFNNEAITGKSSSISLDDAVRNLSFAYNTQNSALGNMSGVVENFSDIQEKGLLVLQKQGKYLGETVGKLDEAGKKEAQYAGIIELTNLTLGSSAKFQGTYTDNLQKLAVESKNASVELGQNLEPAFNEVIKTVLSASAAFRQTGIPALKEFYGFITTNQIVVDTFIISLTTLGTVLTAITISKTVSAFVAFAGILTSTVIPAVQLFFGIFTSGIGFSAIVAQLGVLGKILGGTFVAILSPLGLVTIAIAAVIAIGVLVYRHWDTISAKATELWGFISSTFNTGVNYLKGLFPGFFTYFENFWSSLGGTIGSAWDTITKFVQDGINNARQVLQSTFGFLGNLWNSFWSGLSGFVSGAFGGIVNILTGVFGNIQGVFNSAFGFITGIWSNIFGALPGIATGGTSTLVNIFNGLVSGIQSAFGLLVSIITPIWNGFVGIFNDPLIQSSLGLLNQAFGFLQSTIANFGQDQNTKTLVQTLLAGFTQIKSAITPLVDGFKSIGTAIAGIFSAIDFGKIISGLFTLDIGVLSAEFSKIGVAFNTEIEKIRAGLVTFFSNIQIPSITLPFIGDIKPLIEGALADLNKFKDWFLGDGIAGITGFVNGGLKILNDAFVFLKDTILPAIITAIQSFVGFITGLVTPALQFLGNLFTTVIIPALQSFATWVVSNIIPALQALWNFVSPVLVPALQLIGAIIGTVIVVAIAIVIGAIALFIATLAGIIFVLSQVISAISSFVLGVIGFFSDLGTNIGNIWNGIGQTITNAWNGISSFFVGAFDALGNLWNSFWNNLVKGITIVWNGIVEGVKLGWGFVIGFITTALTGYKILWDRAWNAIATTITTVWETIKTGVSAGIDGVVKFFSGLGSKVTEIISGINLYNVGSSLIQNLANGISGAIGFVRTAVSSIVSAISFGSINIPNNYTGTRNFGGGLSYVSERGDEIIDTGSQRFIARGPQLMNLPRGTDIYNNSDSQKMLSGRANQPQVQILERTKTITNAPVFQNFGSSRTSGFSNLIQSF